MLEKGYKIYKQTGSALSLCVLLMVVAFLIANIKGQYFVGIRGADFLLVSFGIVCANRVFTKD